MDSGDGTNDLDIAQGAVLVKSCEITRTVLGENCFRNDTFIIDLQVPKDAAEIRGYDFNGGIDFSKLMASYSSTGFQASHFGKAVKAVNAMLDEREDVEGNEKAGQFFPYPDQRPIPPCTIFLGYTSNLVTSGIREVVSNLVLIYPSFIH
ncbi:unnamed protein product, partial [Strongylus vulgaris]